jgi:hypothetical protein
MTLINAFWSLAFGSALTVFVALMMMAVVAVVVKDGPSAAMLFDKALIRSLPAGVVASLLAYASLQRHFPHVLDT